MAEPLTSSAATSSQRIVAAAEAKGSSLLWAQRTPANRCSAALLCSSIAQAMVCISSAQYWQEVAVVTVKGSGSFASLHPGKPRSRTCMQLLLHLLLLHLA